MKVVVFSDLDATLLDPENYSWIPAAEAISSLKARDASIVLVSSKTFDEMRPIHRELGLKDPFVVENGGGIAVGDSCPDDLIGRLSNELADATAVGDALLFPLGTKYDELVSELEQIGSELGCELPGFSRMTDAKVADLTGLSVEDAARARTRHFDEPFILPKELRGREHAFLEAATRRGLTAVQGGRFWHLIGHEGKGKAVAILISAHQDLHGRVLTLGLGDSPNDFPFLELVDIPVLLGMTDLPESLPPWLVRARKGPSNGPKAWNTEVLGILGELNSGGLGQN